MGSNTDKMDVTIVNSITLGDFIGVTDRRVRQLADEGVFEPVARGKYELRDCVYRYCNYLRQIAENGAAKKEVKLDLDSERALHEKAKREKAELMLKVMKGELHRSSDVESVMTDMITRAKTKLLGLPSRAAPMIIGYKDIYKIQNTLQKLVEESLNELADYEPELFINDEVIQGDDDE